MTTMTAQATQVYSIFIKASPEQIWEAITTPEFTHRYFYGTHVTVAADEYQSVDGEGNAMIEGSVSEYEPPRRLVHTWLALFDPDQAAEQASRVTWEIEPRDDGTSLLTVVHDQLEGAPKTAESVAGGWMYVLSGLKTLLETGKPLTS
ncbi:MAG: SRPBCC family protein [Gaiellaceae bacterium]